LGAELPRYTDPESLRKALVDTLVRTGAIGNPAIERAFRSVPRHLFVPKAEITDAYTDRPIFLRWEGERPASSSSQPTIMAIMIEQLQLEPGMRVLEVGAGSGYNAAILSELTGVDGHVVSVDIDFSLVVDARRNLTAAGFEAVEVACCDGSIGYSQGAPYDRIIVTADARDVSPCWVGQLAEGGVLVAPLWFKGFSLSVALEKQNTGLRGLSASPCTFIPLRWARERTEGYFPVQGHPDQPLLMSVGLDGPDQIDLAKLGALLRSGDKEFRSIGRSLDGQFFYWQNLYSGLYLSLTTHPGVFALMPMGEDALFQSPAYGVFTADLSSAAILNDRFPEQAMVFGNGQAHSELMELLDQWDALGHPNLHRLKIHALSELPESIPEGSWVIPKHSDYTWVLSWGV
jgi:protein-L-isoaspartate(D-aspartate) O-methyltransferase